jgi:hypothetical protein
VASTGLTIAGAGATVDTGSGPVWANPGNITADDDTMAQITFTGGAGETDDLKGSTFGLAVSAGATIVGIEVTAQLSRAQSGDTVTYINVGKADSTLATAINPGTALTATPTNYTYGSSTDLWGLTWTPAEINASTFQARVRCTASGNFHTVSCDAIWVNIYYTGSEGALASAGVAVGTFVSSSAAEGAMASAGVGAGNFISEGGLSSALSAEGGATATFMTSSTGGARPQLPGVSFRSIRRAGPVVLPLP